MYIRFKKSFIMTLILIVSLASAGTSWAATTPPELSSLLLSKNEISVENGSKATLTVAALYSDGTKKDVTELTRWTNPDDTIATVYNGTVTAKKEGTITATANYGNKNEVLKIIVTKQVKNLTTKTENGSLNLRKGGSVDVILTAHYTDNSTPENVTVKADWSSSNEKVATVLNGKVTALSAGTATITANYGKQVVTVEVNVEIVSRLDLDVNQLSLLLKESKAVKLTATYPEGNATDIPKDVTNDAVWTTSNKKVADVLKGTITAYGAGTATITASYGTEKITLEVDVDTTRKLVVSKQEVYLSLLDTDKGKSTEVLKLEAIYPDKKDPVNVTELATWTSSNTSIAYVNKGTISAEGSGTATITAKYGDKSVTVKVDVDVARHLDLVEKVGMNVGKDQQLELNASYADIVGKINVADKAVWSSSDEAIVFVSKGKISAYKMGEAIISATYGGITVKTKVSVDVPISVSLNAKTVDIKVDSSYTAILTAVYDISDSTKNVNLTSKAEWSTSDEKVAEVNSDGIITGVARGTATITALYNKTKYTLKVSVGLVSVLEADSQLIVLSSVADENSEIKKSKVIVLTAKSSTGVNESIRAEDVTWKSSNPSVAGVKDGKVTGYTKGKATITAEYGGQKVTVSVEVDMIQSIEATHQSVDLKTGLKGPKEAQIKVTATFSDGTAIDVTNSAEWKTSSYKIATANKGKITAVAYGKTKVTVKYAGKTITIPVEVDMLKYLQTDEVSLKLKVKEEVQITATATYVDGSEDNVSKAALWTSSKILAATVKDGKIKATGKGKATITISYGGKKTKVMVVVE